MAFLLKVYSVTFHNLKVMNRNNALLKIIAFPQAYGKRK